MMHLNNNEVKANLEFVDWAMIALFITLIVWFITMLVRK